MQPPAQHSRINLAELKAQLIRKLGPERSKQYLYYLSRLLNSKLSKIEFDRLCLRIVGRENLPLHNHFIRSILKNACTAKEPPPKHGIGAPTPTNAQGSKSASGDVHHQNGYLPGANQASSPVGFPNGDILPLSPRKARTAGIRDRRIGDRRSALGSNGKATLTAQPSSTSHAVGLDVILENGNLNVPDTQRPLQLYQELTQEAENGGGGLGYDPAKFHVTERLPDGLVSVHGKDQIPLLGSDNAKDLSGRSSLHAPLGVPLCPASIGGARRALPLASSSKSRSVFSSDGSLDSATLRERMEQISEAQGLQGVSMECTNVLTFGLDAYLKRLIRSCAELNRARSGHCPASISASKHQPHSKLVNGVIPGHQYQMQNSSWPLEVAQDKKPKCPISLLDFRVAMELNPQQLGEDWPILLEKICTHAFEE